MVNTVLNSMVNLSMAIAVSHNQMVRAKIARLANLVRPEIAAQLELPGSAPARSSSQIRDENQTG